MSFSLFELIHMGKSPVIAAETTERTELWSLMFIGGHTSITFMTGRESLFNKSLTIDSKGRTSYGMSFIKNPIFL